MAKAGSFTDKVDATIRVVNGTIKVDPDPIQVKAGGSVTWVCQDGDWQIIMKKKPSPLKNGGSVGGGKGKREGDTVREDAHQGGSQGRYSYDVRVQTGDGPVTVDPDVVVGPPE